MYLVSACLAGICCRYDGNSNDIDIIKQLVKNGKAVPVCPEVLGKMPIPRVCCEIIKDSNNTKRIIGKDGRDYTKNFLDGAHKALAIAKEIEAEIAILKAKSPSCGCGLIYDGNFTGKLIEGNGFAAKLLLDSGIKVYTEKDLDILNELNIK